MHKMKRELMITMKAWIAGAASVLVFYAKSCLQYRNRKRIEQEVKNLNPVSRLSSEELSLQYRNRKTIEQEIKSLNPWFYELEIFGVKVKPGVYPPKAERSLNTRGLINGQTYRKVLFVDEVAKRFDFSGARILDIGCNCGYWSSIYITRYGAESVVGIEGRELFIKQANLYYSSLGIQDKALFIHSNIMECDYKSLGEGVFDFVLCAGILYHIKHHEELLKEISYVNSKVLFIDTRVSEKGEELVEPKNLWFNAIEETRDKKVPQKDDLINILHKLGYKTELIPARFKAIYGVQGVGNYTAGKRLCIFCIKG
jgi:2-polyprenyl-3-methyl-5-hydroxy-6-metoxy-1,4-benzoquinol methylase